MSVERGEVWRLQYERGSSDGVTLLRFTACEGEGGGGAAIKLCRCVLVYLCVLVCGAQHVNTSYRRDKEYSEWLV